MSEPILIALIQLFAIIAASKQKHLTINARIIIESYLKQYLNNKELEEYLLLYDELFSFHEMNDAEQWKKQETLDTIAKIAKGVNKKLQRKDKLIVFIKFIEFIEQIDIDSIQEKKENTEYNFAFYKILQQIFNLAPQEVNNLVKFIINPFDKTEIHNILLIVSSEKENKYPTAKHLYRERLNGHILILYFESADLFIGRYLGHDDNFINGHYIPSNQSFIINLGSIIKNQKIAPIYYSDIASALMSAQQNVKISFNADNIAYTFKNSNNGVKPFSFSAESGQLIGVMGGSGAGKSTLLSMLNGNIALDQGHIYINGHDFASEKEKLKSIIGYIPQDDLLIDELTVFQNLYFNARLCYSHFSSYKLKRIILKILADVDLMSIRDLVVGNALNKVISGGQRKRLNIALELIREPYVLFADEPTSGLSSMDSEMVMLLLKEQTLKGRMVTVNIHQPSSNIFKLFDKLLILDKGGYPIYFGNPIDSVGYFKAISNHVNQTDSECLSCGYVNPEQIFEITEAKTINKHGKVTNQRVFLPEKWYSLFKKNNQEQLNKPVVIEDLPANNFKIPNKINQFKIFSLRNLYIKLTNKQYLQINLLEAPLLALILSYLIRYSSESDYNFGDNKNFAAYLFMGVIVALFLGMMVSADEIIKDRKILKRESFLMLSRGSYLNSKILFLFFLSAIQTFLFILIGNLVLQVKDMYFSYWLILFSTSCFANMVGLNISSGLNSIVNIYILIPFVLIPQILLSGVIVPFERLNPNISNTERVPIIGDLMASRWAFEALTVEQYKNNKFTKNLFQYDQKLSNYAYKRGYLVSTIKAKLETTLINNSNGEDTKQDLKILKNEITALARKSRIKTDIYKQFSEDAFNDSVKALTFIYLDSIKNYYSDLYRNVQKKRDELFVQMENEIGKNEVLELKQTAYNQDLANILLNRGINKSIVEGKNGFIRKKEPIYMIPKSKIGRAHFYAPVKVISHYHIDTFWFNLFAIWLMTLTLYITLINNSLRKALNYFETIKKVKNTRLKK